METLPPALMDMMLVHLSLADLRAFGQTSKANRVHAKAQYGPCVPCASGVYRKYLWHKRAGRNEYAVCRAWLACVGTEWSRVPLCHRHVGMFVKLPGRLKGHPKCDCGSCYLVYH